MTKKVLAVLVLLAFVLPIALFAGGQKEAAPKEKIIAAMATDIGGLGDKSFNDGSYAGILQAPHELADVALLATRPGLPPPATAHGVPELQVGR